MVQNHILNEIQYRLLNTSQMPAPLNDLAMALGIDIDAASDPLPTADEAAPTTPLPGFLASESEPFRGAIPFELRLDALGTATTHHCRAVYEVTLIDAEDSPPEARGRILGSSAIGFQILSWLDPDKHDENTGRRVRLPAPRWEDVDLYNLIPEQVLERIDDLIEGEVRAAELAASKSTA